MKSKLKWTAVAAVLFSLSGPAIFSSSAAPATSSGVVFGTDGERDGQWDDLQQYLRQQPAGEVRQSLGQVAAARQRFTELAARRHR